MRRSIGMLVVLVSLPAALLLVLGFFGPVLALADSASHFRLHLSVALLGAAAILVLARWWMAAGALLALAVAGGFSTAALSGLLTPAAALPKGEALRLYSFNLKYTNVNIDEVIRQIGDADPDVVFLQELSRINQPILAALRGTYRLATDCHRYGGDVAILVRARYRPTDATGCEPSRGIAWSGVALGAREVTLVAVHLHWPAPFSQPRDLDALEHNFAAMKRPLVAAGDFNAVPWSHAVARVAAATDTTVVPGIRPSFLPRALPDALLPLLGLPIDHVLLPDGAAAKAIGLLPRAGSDHRPVLADIVLP